MQPEEIRDLYDREERFLAEWPLLLREESPLLVRQVPSRSRAGGDPSAAAQPAGRTAVIAWSRLDETTADRAIAEQVAWARTNDLTLSWKLYDHDTPADLAQKLVANGLEAQEPESIMVLELARAPAALRELSPLDVRRITDPALVAHVQQVNRAVWGEDQPELHAELADTLLSRPDALSVYVAYHEDLPVASAWLRLREGRPFASLWGGSTLPQFRKMGFYTALLAVRVREAIRRGARFLTVDAGPMSRPIVERHGFQRIATACDYDLP